MENQNLLFSEYEEVKPILSIGQYALVRYQKPDKKKRGITNQRQAVTKEIQDIIESENGGKINAKVLAMKLSHCDLETLYFMKSEGLDYRRRTGKPFGKYIYGSIRPRNDKDGKLSTT